MQLDSDNTALVQAQPDTEVALWRRLRSTGCPAAREALITRHLDSARMHAAKLYRMRYSSDIEFSDYLQFATVGLIESIDRYDPERQVKFSTFAAPRINGAVLDGLAKMSEQRQQVLLKQRIVRERVESLSGGAPGRRQQPEQVFNALAEIAVGLALGFMMEETRIVLDEEESVDNAYADVEFKQLSKQLRHLIDLLPAQERMVIRYHYLQRLPFETVANIMSLSKGRISQLHKRGLESLHVAAGKLSRRHIAW